MAAARAAYDWKYTTLEPWTSGSKYGSCSPADAALYLGVTHVWLSEAGYDEEWADVDIAAGELLRDYVLGNTDGIAKTPCWAADRSGLPAYTIKALARQWGKEALQAVGSEDHVAELIATVESTQAERAGGAGAEGAAGAVATGLPGGLIGGTVYDYEFDEVIEGALVTATPTVEDGSDCAGAEGEAAATTTDEFGNFLLDAPGRGSYVISIEKEGYRAKTWGPLGPGDGAGPREFPMFTDCGRLLSW